MLFLVFFITLAISSFAQNCSQSEADKFYKCLNKAVPDFKEIPHGQVQKPVDKTKRDECYTKNKCKPPKNLAEPHQPPQELKNDKLKQCFKTNADSFKKCFQGKGAHFPAEKGMNDNKTLDEVYDELQNDLNGGIDPAECPAGGAVKSCLESLQHGGNKTAGNHTGSDKEKKETHDKLCKNINACITAMSKPCQDLLHKTRKNLCICATAQKSSVEKCFSSIQKGMGELMVNHLCEDKCNKRNFKEDKEEHH